MTKCLTLGYKLRHDISLLSALITTWLKGNLGQGKIKEATVLLFVLLQNSGLTKP